MGKGSYAIRGKPTSRICEEVERKGIFDKAVCEGPRGQPGVFVNVVRGKLEATLRRVGTPSSEGYNGTHENPTRITYLTISRGQKQYGLYDPGELIRSPRHKFEKNAESNPELKGFLKDILKYFNGL